MVLILLLFMPAIVALPAWFRDSRAGLAAFAGAFFGAALVVSYGKSQLMGVVDRLAGFARTTWRVYTWAPDEQTRRLVLGIAAGMLAHQIFGLTDAFLLSTKPGIVMWILMGIITGLYLNLAPEHLKPGEPAES